MDKTKGRIKAGEGPLIGNAGKNINIRVKTRTEDYRIWQYSAKKDGAIFRYLSAKNDFTVLVRPFAIVPSLVK